MGIYVAQTKTEPVSVLLSNRQLGKGRKIKCTSTSLEPYL